jgi:hypothetical protein
VTVSLAHCGTELALDEGEGGGGSGRSLGDSGCVGGGGRRGGGSGGGGGVNERKENERQIEKGGGLEGVGA